MKLTLLNTAILTSFGSFDFSSISLDEARQMVGSSTVQSAIGHAATADVLTDLLGIAVAANRIEYKQELGEIAIVFKLKSRIPEGRVLSRGEIEAMGYDFGVLRRIK